MATITDLLNYKLRQEGCRLGYNVQCAVGVDNKCNTDECPLVIMVYEYCPDCYTKHERKDNLDAPGFCKICGSGVRRYSSKVERDRECSIESMSEYVRKHGRY